MTTRVFWKGLAEVVWLGVCLIVLAFALAYFHFGYKAVVLSHVFPYFSRIVSWFGTRPPVSHSESHLSLIFGALFQIAVPLRRVVLDGLTTTCRNSFRADPIASGSQDR